MNAEGYNAIADACAAAHIDVAITPEPAVGENVRFVTVETFEKVIPADMLNALVAHGLMYSNEPKVFGLRNMPELSLVSERPGSYTFEDKNKIQFRM